MTAKTTRPVAKTAPADFYKQALSAAEQADLPAALEVEGIDQEIALLRLRLRTALIERPEDLPLMLKGVEMLARTVATRFRLSKKSERDLAASLANVIRSVGEIWPQETADD